MYHPSSLGTHSKYISLIATTKPRIMHLKSILFVGLIIWAEIRPNNSFISSLYHDRQKTNRDKFTECLQNSAKEVVNAAMKIGFRVPRTIADAVDLMSQKLLRDSDRDPDILEGLLDELQFKDFLPNDLRRITIDKSAVSYLVRRTSNLALIVLNAYENKHVARSLSNSKQPSKKVATAQLDKVEKKISDLPLGDQLELKQALITEYGDVVQDISIDTCQAKRRKRSANRAMACFKRGLFLGAKAAFVLCKRVAQVGIMVLDHLYMAPELICELPVIGQAVREMRKKGEPLYKMVQFVRSYHYLYKVRTRKSFAGDEIFDESEDEYDLEGGIYSDEDRVKIEEARRLIGEAGIDALKLVVKKIYERYTNNENGKQELISRTIMAFITTLMETKMKLPSLMPNFVGLF